MSKPGHNSMSTYMAGRLYPVSLSLVVWCEHDYDSWNTAPVQAEVTACAYRLK